MKTIEAIDAVVGDKVKLKNAKSKPLYYEIAGKNDEGAGEIAFELHPVYSSDDVESLEGRDLADDEDDAE